MNENDMTNEYSTFTEWYRTLCKIAVEQGGSAADVEAWRDDYDAGKTPRQSWEDEWGWNDTQA